MWEGLVRTKDTLHLQIWESCIYNVVFSQKAGCQTKQPDLSKRRGDTSLKGNLHRRVWAEGDPYPYPICSFTKILVLALLTWTRQAPQQGRVRERHKK